MKIKIKYFLIGIYSSFLLSCDKGKEVPNIPPETKTTLESINLSGENRLNTVVNIQWSGTDKDGYIKNYEISFDKITWTSTQLQDSIFKFSIPAGGDTTDIIFNVRAIDDKGEKDPTPATLKIPIKNSPPIVSYEDKYLPEDSVLAVVTLAWKASDPDGFNTIDSLYIKANNGPWYPIKKDANFISIIPEQPGITGVGNAYVNYGSGNAQAKLLSGLKVQDTNRFYIKAVDISGAESVLDTTGTIFIQRKKSDLLLIGAHSQNTKVLGYFGPNISFFSEYDFLDYYAVAGSGINHPKRWDPTFNLLLGLFDKVFIATDDKQFTNLLSGQTGLFVEHISSPIRNYLDNGGKLFISSLFSNPPSTSSIFGTLPMDSLVKTTSSLYIAKDSTLIPEVSGFPKLKASEFIISMDPFYPSADAEIIYTAKLNNGAWTGGKVMGARRKNSSGKTNLIFLSLELYKLSGDAGASKLLFEKIITNEFNW